MEAITREEKLMSAASSGKSSGIKPITREEMYLSYIAGESKKKPKPITRKEMFLDKIEKGEGGDTSGGGDIVPLLEGTIEEITIPNEVTNLAKGVFGGCSVLKEINADESHTVYKSSDGILYTKDGKKLVSYPPAKEETEYIMPDSVEKIEKMAFNNTTTLEKVILSDNIKSLPENIAIENKNAEIALVLNPDILAQGDVYPVGSPLITTVTIPEDSTYLSATAFDNMKNIENLYYNAECELEKVGISDGKSSYELNGIQKLQNLKKVVIGSGVKTVPDEFLSGYYSKLGSTVETLIIGDDVESIGNEAFCTLSSIKELRIGDNVKSIGGTAFYGLRSVEGTLIIPDSVTELGSVDDWGMQRYETFGSMSKITNVIIGKGLSELVNGMFSFCDSLTEVTIPSNIKTIGQSAFSSCGALSRVEIQEGVETIEYNAFAFCNNLANIYIPRSVNTIELAGFENMGGNVEGGLTIHGYAGSYAETFATENGFNFEVIEE